MADDAGYSPDPGEPPPADDEGIVRLSTPDGEAAIELVLEVEQIHAGDPLEFSLVNRGTVTLMTGRPYVIRRWQDDAWQRYHLPLPKGIHARAFTLEGITLKPGRAAPPDHWPSPLDPAPEPGLYRVSKSAHYEGTPADRQRQALVASARFRVVA